MLPSKFPVSDSKKSKFIKDQDTIGILRNIINGISSIFG